MAAFVLAPASRPLRGGARTARSRGRCRAPGIEVALHLAAAELSQNASPARPFRRLRRWCGFPVRPRGPRPSGARPSVPALRDVVTKLRSILILAMGKAMEVAERGIAGPEVVEREADAEVEKLGEDAGQAMVLADEGRFGDLEFEAPSDRARTRRGPSAPPRRCRRPGRERRDVHGDLGRLRPAQCVPAGLVQHEGAQRVDQARFLRDRNEVRRRDHPPFGMTPRTRASAPVQASSRRGLGLVDQLETARSRWPCARSRSTPAGRAVAVSMPGSNSTTGGRRPLRLMEGDVGPAPAPRGRASLGREGDADAGSDGPRCPFTS